MGKLNLVHCILGLVFLGVTIVFLGFGFRVESLFTGFASVILLGYELRSIL